MINSCGRRPHGTIGKDIRTRNPIEKLRTETRKGGDQELKKAVAEGVVGLSLRRYSRSLDLLLRKIRRSQEARRKRGDESNQRFYGLDPPMQTTSPAEGPTCSVYLT